MTIGSTLYPPVATQALKAGNSLQTSKVQDSQPTQDKPFIRELAGSFNPKSMSFQESLDLANSLMKAGEGSISSVFLPDTLLKLNDDESISNYAGTPEGDERMSRKFNMPDRLNSVIEYRKENNQSTKIFDDALGFLEKLQVAKTTPSIDEFT